MSLPKKPPVDLELLSSMAKRFADRDMYDEADELFQLALRFAPNNMGIQLNLAEVRKHRRQSLGDSTRDAEAALREQMRRNAIDSAHFFGLAALYEERGKPDLAAECLQIAGSKDIVNPYVHKLNGKLLFRDKDYDAAGRELRRAQRYNPFDCEIADLLGRVEYEREHYREAIEATIDAFLLLQDDEREKGKHLKKRIRKLKTIRRISSADLVELFRERREKLQTAFDRLELQRERFLRDDDRTQKVRIKPPAKPQSGRLELARRLRGIEAWAHLSDEQIFHLTGAAHEEHFDKGFEIFAYGSSGSDIYIVEKGTVAIRRRTAYGNYLLGSLGPGDVFGEINFILPGERSGDAVAGQNCELIRLAPNALQAVLDEHPELGVQVFWGFWHGLAQKLRSANEQLRTFFAEEHPVDSLQELQSHAEAGAVDVGADDKIELFREQGLSGSELETLANFSNVKRYPGGTFLFREGDAGHEMYVVLEGQVMISKFIPGGGEEALAILDRGDFFGEMSLIDGEPRSADAKAFQGPVTVVTFDDQTLNEIMAMDPRAARSFMVLLCRLICKRMREIDEKVTSWRIMSGAPGDPLDAAVPEAAAPDAAA
ncbi:MAG: cyclic nucleotide-binding domain-containing protein [Acidobacteriota bacterium]